MALVLFCSADLQNNKFLSQNYFCKLNDKWGLPDEGKPDVIVHLSISLYFVSDMDTDLQAAAYGLVCFAVENILRDTLQFKIAKALLQHRDSQI